MIFDVMSSFTSDPLVPVKQLVPLPQVRVFKKTMAQRMPATKLLSEMAPPGDPTASGAVRFEREYK